MPTPGILQSLYQTRSILGSPYLGKPTIFVDFGLLAELDYDSRLAAIAEGELKAQARERGFSGLLGHPTN